MVCVTITEIPIQGRYCWIEQYEAFLKTLVVDNKDDKKKKVLDFYSKPDNNKIDITVEFRGNELQKLVKSGKGDVEKFLKLSANMTVNNLNLYNSKNVITCYESPVEILEDFFEFRLKMYGVRKKKYLNILNNELDILKYKIKYIKDYNDEVIVVKNRKRKDVIKDLEKLGYPRLFPTANHKIGHKEKEEEKGDNESESDTGDENDDTSDTKKKIKEDSDVGYKYVSSMTIFSLTKEQIEKLNEQYKKKKDERDDYNSTSELDIWKREVLELRDAYQKWLIERKDDEEDDDIEIGKDGKIKKRKKSKAKKSKEGKSEKSEKNKAK